MNLQLQKEQNKGIVRLHNNLIEAIFSLSVDAKKLLLAILLHINNNDGKNIEIYRKDICKKVGIDLKELNNKHREGIIEELMTKIVTIREIVNPSNWTKIQLVGKTTYKNGYLKTSIDEELMPYILEARERLFTRFNIQNIKPLTSIYAVRLYLLAKQFGDTGWRDLNVDEFREMLELGNKYYRIFDLKKRVLEPAKRQINERTDININYELIKEGRRYTKVKLYISKDKDRVERKENKKLIEQNKFAELEAKLNAQYRYKALKAKDGLTWFVKQIKVLSDKEVELILTDLSAVTTFKVKLEQLPEIFTKNSSKEENS